MGSVHQVDTTVAESAKIVVVPYGCDRCLMTSRKSWMMEVKKQMRGTGQSEDGERQDMNMHGAEFTVYRCWWMALRATWTIAEWSSQGAPSHSCHLAWATERLFGTKQGAAGLATPACDLGPDASVPLEISSQPSPVDQAPWLIASFFTSYS